ncbi:MAG: hypothetical protein ACR2HG_00545 [Pyrinomonadaceae bacterium]
MIFKSNWSADGSSANGADATLCVLITRDFFSKAHHSLRSDSGRAVRAPTGLLKTIL